MGNKKAVSSLHGTTPGYEPQWRERSDEPWQKIHWARATNKPGVPFPLHCGGILQSAWHLSHAQAQAIAWQFAAEWESKCYSKIEVRVVERSIRYAIDVDEIEESGGSDDNHESQ